MVTNKKTWRFYSCLFLAFVLVLLLFSHGPTAAAKSKEYVDSLLKHTEEDDEWRWPASPDVDLDPGQDEEGYRKDKLFFEFELPYDMPKFDVNALRKLPPQNYRGPGHETFATFFLSRNTSLHDPYYLATHQVVYRLLWNQASKSTKHPVVVYVAPFVTDEQRSYFEAAGAIVREVAQHPFRPNGDVVGLLAHRLKDVFSKLEMWGDTEFSRIAYLDSDAFPLVNVDALLEDKSLTPDRQCNIDLLLATLPAEEQHHAAEMCDYVFAGVQDLYLHHMMNAGVMVLKPNQGMYDLLIREFHHQDNFDNGFVEQSLLGYVFDPEGPFPPTYISQAGTGDPQYRDDGNELYVLHAKIWALWFDDSHNDHWATFIFRDTWNNLTALYQSEEFPQLRAGLHGF